MALTPGKKERTRVRGCKLMDLVERQEIARLHDCHPNTIRNRLHAGSLASRSVEDVVKDYHKRMVKRGK